MLEGGPFLKDWWVKVSDEFVPYLNITAASPRDPDAASMKDKPDQGLLAAKGGGGFPYCIFMDSEGAVLKELRPMDDASFRGGMAPVAQLVMWRQKAATSTGDAKTKAENNLKLLDAVFSPDDTKFAELQKVAAGADIEVDIKAVFDALVKTWPVRKAVDVFSAAADKARNTRDRAAFDAAQKTFQDKLLAAYKTGVTIEDPSSPLFDDFWYSLTQAALSSGDKATALAGLDRLDVKFKDDPRASEHFAGLRKQAEAIGAEKPVDEKPVDEKPVDEKPVDGKG